MSERTCHSGYERGEGDGYAFCVLPWLHDEDHSDGASLSWPWRASERWYNQNQDRNGQSPSDHPTVRVWYPRSLPYVSLQTISTGCNEPDVLPTGPVHADIQVAGVTIGGRLEDLELLWAAVGEGLTFARHRADEMLLDRVDAASRSPEESTDG